jgi:phosphate transport system substrate-binding protein
MRRLYVLIAALGLAAAIGTSWSCNGGPGGGTAITPAATILIDGSSTVFLISKAAQEAYNAVNPGVTVVVDNHGTGGGFGRYLQGEVDIVNASRPAEPDEESKAKAQAIDWTRFVVGYDGITLVVNPKNGFAKALSLDQLKAIWQSNSKVKTWKDVEPSWPERGIVLYSPDNDSGTFDFFTEAITGKRKDQRSDVQQSSDDNTLVNGVAGDPDGLGYFGYAYYAANTDKLRSVAVQNGPTAAPVYPSPSTIADKTYAPLSRPLFIYVKNSAARRPEVAAFLKFYIDTVDRLAVKKGYNAPTAADQAANRATLSELLGTGAGASAAGPRSE